MRTILFGALAWLSSCTTEEAMTAPRPATVTTTAVSKPSLDLRGEVDVALKNDEALLLLSVWAAVGHFGGAATNP
ncbi:MAG: hypothetical protein DI536_13160 [Archangium gephyra]|uniref:Uncharacterized protein n=1 Tax=Archangium gephyra TaxID=48 RepID=A0A2W5TCI5_9BACT|nr:MAG: hypothetical protein DI536_13160 [Archangium gephyra]